MAGCFASRNCLRGAFRLKDGASPASPFPRGAWERVQWALQRAGIASPNPLSPWFIHSLSFLPHPSLDPTEPNHYRSPPSRFSGGRQGCRHGLFFCLLSSSGVQGSMKRLVLLCCGAAILGGCSSWLGGPTMRSQSPDEPEPDEPDRRLVGDLGVPTGMEYAGRGGRVGYRPARDGERSWSFVQRGALLDEMQARGLSIANAVLGSGDVSLCCCKGFYGPAFRRATFRRGNPRSIAERNH